MNQLEKQLADLLLTSAIKRIEDVTASYGLIDCYSRLINAASINERHQSVVDYSNRIATAKAATAQPTLEVAVDETPVAESCGTVVTTPAEDKPKRTRRTKEQIAADEAAAACANGGGVLTEEPETPDREANAICLEAANEVNAAVAERKQAEAEEIQIDDVGVPDAVPKMTHGQVQELFTLKLKNIAVNKGDMNGFKARLRDVLTDMGSPAGISKLPEANLAAFHAKLVNLV